MSTERGRSTLILCAAAAIALAAGCGGEETTSSSSTTTSTPRERPAEPAEPTALRRQLERELRGLLASGSGPKLDAECVIEELRTSLPNRVVEAAVESIRSGAEVPQPAIDAAFEAGRRCRGG